jgi:hypothetical protein
MKISSEDLLNSNFVCHVGADSSTLVPSRVSLFSPRSPIEIPSLRSAVGKVLIGSVAVAFLRQGLSSLLLGTLRAGPKLLHIQLNRIRGSGELRVVCPVVFLLIKLSPHTFRAAAVVWEPRREVDRIELSWISLCESALSRNHRLRWNAESLQQLLRGVAVLLQGLQQVGQDLAPEAVRGGGSDAQQVRPTLGTVHGVAELTLQPKHQKGFSTRSWLRHALRDQPGSVQQLQQDAAHSPQVVTTIIGKAHRPLQGGVHRILCGGD